MAGARSNRTPLVVRMALLRNKTERERSILPPVVPCEPGDRVIVSLNGRYRNGEVVRLPWHTDEGRYVRVQLDEGVVKLKSCQVVKVET